MSCMPARNSAANSDAVNGTSAVEVTSVTRISVASRPISAAIAGEAIIGEAMPCSISARNRSGELVSKPVTRATRPKIKGTPIVVQAVAAMINADGADAPGAPRGRRA